MARLHRGDAHLTPFPFAQRGERRSRESGPGNGSGEIDAIKREMDRHARTARKAGKQSRKQPRDAKS